MVIKVLFPLCLLTTSVPAQNLIINPDFEISTKKSIEICKGWSCGGTVDYFHYNQSEISLQIPNKQFGLVKPLNGKAYVGFVPFTWDNTGQMEHIIGTTTTPLVRGHSYRFSFYYRYSGSTSFYTAKKLEVLFTVPQFFLSFYTYYKDYKEENIKCTFSNNIISDTVWTKYEGEFIAKGGEKTFVIGLFVQNDFDVIKLLDKYESVKDNPKRKAKFINTNTFLISPNPNYKKHNYVREDWPYYFIDKVELYDIAKERNDKIYLVNPLNMSS